ncbi:hypothetical protein [Actinomadura madurae]|uniref:hypothetical protein n=1 Tax=Actinomadura madurae TaxID=1993 RepID=UPI0020D22804|nr:hypothetical protein [Actinomadura madurae]MCP9947263.1 hypothetical protein [Actinomadura madurae]MCP9964024.1 hypothetical protein [Actinomadura madurae]MCP9976500.1 hypothetical protein [Actinomadura madurae]
MTTSRALTIAGPAALILAFAIGFWPVHASVGLGTADCGSAFRPVHASDSYDVLSDPTGAGLTAAGLMDDRCEAARSGPAYLARAGVAGGVVLLIVAGVRGRRRRAVAEA